VSQISEVIIVIRAFPPTDEPPPGRRLRALVTRGVASARPEAVTLAAGLFALVGLPYNRFTE